MKSKRLEYKLAITAKKWDEAAELVRKNPDIFGIPPAGVSDELASVASDPEKVTYMLVEWSADKITCKDPEKKCKSYALNANQFDHLQGDHTDREIQDWYNRYVHNRKIHASSTSSLGETMFLLKVIEITPITNFEGNPING